MNLVDAALLDQERRILEASPKEVQGSASKWPRVPCEAKCGAMLAHNSKNHFCRKCREARRAR